MANLVMTIDSDSDTQETKPQIGKQVAQKKQKKSQAIETLISNPEKADDAEILLPSKEANDNWFWTEKDENKKKTGQENEFMVKDDGGKQTLWNFGAQIKLDPTRRLGNEQSNWDEGQEQTKDDSADEKQNEPEKDETMQERTSRLLEERAIVINSHLTKEKKSKDQSSTHESLIKNKEATFHYDKEDLVQFHELMLQKPLIRACSDLDYMHPTMIQRRVIPTVLDGHDVLAHAVTGSGKTASYVLPILQKYLRYRQTLDTDIGRLRYLVLQPTRELAAQSHAMLQNLAKYIPSSFNSAALFGGSSLKDERRKITQESPDLVIATPGRLIDHMHNTKSFTLDYVEVLVLDEADRLLEMGFNDELMQVLKQCTCPKRQTLMLSATLNQDLKELAKLALKAPQQFSVDKQQRAASAQALKLTQYLVRLQFEGLATPKKGSLSYDKVQKVQKKKKKKLDPDHPDFDSEEEYGNENESNHGDDDESQDFSDEEEGEEEFEELATKGKSAIQFVGKRTPADQFLAKREATLISILSKTFNSRVIIFANEKAQCTRLMALLTIFGMKAAEIHSNRTQDERLKAIEQFQKGEVDYLIGTDVISRGLDIPNVRTVINFSFPTEPKRYLHRIGRTARAGQHGIAVNLCNEEERKELKKLTRKLNQNMNTFTVQNKFVENYFDLIVNKLDEVVKTAQCELDQAKEMKEAMRDIERSNNMIKYKEEIMSRPKKEWFVGNKRRSEVAKESKQDLKNIKTKFEDQLTNQERNKHKRDKKRTSKQNEKQATPQSRAKKGESAFKSDFENGKKPKFSKGEQKGGGEPNKAAQKPAYFKKKKHLKKK